MSSDSTGLLKDRVLFIAGVGPQMGAATARIAAREGARVTLAARSQRVAQDLAQEIRAAGGAAIALECDVTRPESARAAVETATAELGPIDAVFYNAAFYDFRQTSIDIDDDLWRRTMDVNLNGALTLTRLILPSMVERGRGAFVYNSSAASLEADEIMFGYGVAKSALNAVMRFVAAKYGRAGVRANAIFPFVVEGDAAQVPASQNCLGRSGLAEEIGEAVVFLLSDRASIITGQLIHLDGGLNARAAWSPATATTSKALGEKANRPP